MSKQKQKGKKNELEGFDLKKEKELLKKLEDQEEGEEEVEEIEPIQKKQNLFSNDLFQKAQALESKKNKKKKNKTQETLTKQQTDQDNKELDDSEEEKLEEENENDEEERIKEAILEEIERRKIEHEFGELDVQIKRPQRKQEKPKQERSNKSERVKNLEKIAKALEKDQPLEKEEKSGKLWNISITIFLILFAVLLLYSKYNQEKYQRIARYNRGEGLQEDLYEILELDSSAGPQEVKKQFKKLAVAWHPDKNPGCGQPCNEKFDKIHKAYEILSDPEKKKNYDENSGVFSPIKSKTVSLTIHNYKRLVEESNDIWIIQVYEDGNPTCIHIADTWDMVAKSYGGSVKFGRVNAMSQQKLLNRLPYHITLFPTIMAVVPGQYPDIFTWSRYNLDLALKKFIEGNIINFINPVTEKSYLAMWGDKTENRYSSEKRKPEIIYITNSDSTPIFYKYAAFQLHEQFDFYQNTFGEANKIRKVLEKSKLDFVVKVDQLKDENKEDRYGRNTFYFQMNEGLISNYFNKISEFVKFNTVPELDKYLYAEFCGGNEGSSMGSEDFEDELKPSICILLLKNSTNEASHQKNIYEIQKYQKVKSQKLYLNIVNNEAMFENYYQIRFGAIDLNRQPKFKRIIEEFSQKNEHAFPSAIAFIHENGKYFTWDNTYDLIDFVEKIENNDDNLEASYASEILGTSHLGEYLFSRNENIFTVFYKSFKDTLSDFKILTALAVVVLMNNFVLKKTFGASVVNGVMLYVLLSLVLAVFGTYQELF